MLTKHLLKISLMLPLVAMSATAYAGSTITDKSYWPSEARQSAQTRTGSWQSDLNSALAYDRAASPLQPMTNTSDGSARRYHGGPKSPWGIAFGAQRVAEKHRPPQPFYVCVHQNVVSIHGLKSSRSDHQQPWASTARHM